MNTERQSGILLHISSLPGAWGIGEIGPEARAFGDMLSEMGQTLWQILPLGPIGYGWSPYSSPSAFSANPLFISFDDLMEEGLLSRRNLTRFPHCEAHHVDYKHIVEARMKILKRVVESFEPDAAFERFCKRERSWLADWALFAALKEKHYGMPWMEWPEPLRMREPAALEKACVQCARNIHAHKVLQYLFECQWKKLRRHLKKRRVELIGDIPIFVAGDSADVWAHPELFFLDDARDATVVAGVPPDYFSETGQRWGNPLYDWEAHRETGYRWWTARMKRMFDLVDVVRIDHFRAFESYWEIPASEPTAMHGHWRKGPGLDFFETLEKKLKRNLGECVIAENLGMITKKVETLRKEAGLPGMWVLHFRFNPDDLHKHGYRPEGREENWAVYTGTHDNDTTRGWFGHLPDRHHVLEYLKSTGHEIHRDLMACALHSPARCVILPMQDVLGLGSEARMNTPGTVKGNWSWRFEPDMLTDETKARLHELTTKTMRDA